MPRQGCIRKRINAQLSDEDAPAVASGSAASASDPHKGGIKRRQDKAQCAMREPTEEASKLPLNKSLKRDWGQGKVSAKQVEEYMTGAAAQGASGIPKLASAQNPQNMQRSLLAAFGHPTGAPNFAWIEIPTKLGKVAHPFLLPHVWFMSLFMSAQCLWQSAVAGAEGAISEFWGHMKDSAFARAHPVLDLSNLEKVIPLGLHGDA